ncbi:DNA-binding transcriptional regulator, IclR family [Thermomonospora echinospora]|uniref:DNA-binding transcriptional regulator, IclR family n=1 Tax=Thermomonospora echinospora TaxID=1992 RepID=A0A1H6E8A8_9ACTN|nr:IclR family transcriptional regulator [Thermomonospora echinospora]SEG93483.1 DNA-binding transcriptional regulator, IclR family [Thermomonospora echinospora]
MREQTADPAVRRDPPPSMVERMTLILDAFDGRSARLTLEDVARRTGLPRSTAHRILDQLVRQRWLEHNAHGYGLGRRALRLGGRDGGHGRIREVAAPLLHELQITTGLVAQLAVLDGAEVYYLDKVGGRFASCVPSRVGGRAPAHSTALGKAMLAWLEPEQVDARLGAGLHRLTSRTIGDLGTLHQELHRIRQRRGLAFERGESFPGIACVAAAIRGQEGPAAGISLVGDVRTPLENVAPLVAAAAREASLTLFPGSGTARRARARRAECVRPEPGATWSPETLNRLLALDGRGEWM